MADFKYQLGDLVYIDPVGDALNAPQGKVTGHTIWLDGPPSYIVATMSYGKQGEICVSRHSLAEYEIRPIKGD